MTLFETRGREGRIACIIGTWRKPFTLRKRIFKRQITTTGHSGFQLTIHGAKKISLGDCRDIMIGLDLEPTTTIQEADALSALLRKHVTTIRLQSM